jgi:hypothetical protein
MNERHNFKVGDIVTVFCCSYRQLVIEGRAVIKKILSSEDYYAVEFQEPKQGGRYRYRYVDPNGQDNPEAYVKQLNGINPNI